MPEQDLEQGNISVRNAVKIKTPERRCIKVCRMTVETTALLLGIVTLCLMGIIPVTTIKINIEKHAQTIMCIVINLTISIFLILI